MNSFAERKARLRIEAGTFSAKDLDAIRIIDRFRELKKSIEADADSIAADILKILLDQLDLIENAIEDDSFPDGSRALWVDVHLSLLSNYYNHQKGIRSDGESISTICT